MPFPTAANSLVAGLIRNQEGKVLLIVTPESGWVFPEGEIEIGEEPIEALTRIVKEIIDINITVNKLVGVYSDINIKINCDNESTPSKNIHLDFICTIASDELMETEEIYELGWFNEEDVLGIVTHPVVKERLEYMLNYNGSVYMLSKKIVKGL